MEVWKAIEGSEVYEVSSLGNVRNKNKKKNFALHVANSGYYQVSLKYGFGKTVMVHRLVAQAFIPNPGNKPQVNHKNGVKADNSANNLEWVTQSENMKHCYATGLMKEHSKAQKGKFGADHNRSLAVVQYSPEGKELGRYGSMSEASRILGIPVATIHWLSTKGTPYRRDKTRFAKV